MGEVYRARDTLLDRDVALKVLPAVFSSDAERLAKTMGVDSTTLEANAAMQSIVRRDTGETYMGYLKRVAEVEGIEAPDVARPTKKTRRAAPRSSRNQSITLNSYHIGWSNRAHLVGQPVINP